jgi:hypothetical protein
VDPEHQDRGDDAHAAVGGHTVKLAARGGRVLAVLERVEAQRRPDLAVAEGELPQVFDAVDARSLAHVGAGERAAGEQRPQVAVLVSFDLHRAELDDRVGQIDGPAQLVDELTDEPLRHAGDRSYPVELVPWRNAAPDHHCRFG